MAITDEQVKAAMEAYHQGSVCNNVPQKVKDMRAALEAAEAIGAQAKRIAELEAENAKLREALKPLAKYADEPAIIYEHEGVCML
jgi:hypothetical protein